MLPDPSSESIALAFLERYHRDLEAGQAHDLAHYLALYPGHAELIAREFLAARGELTDLGAEPLRNTSWSPARGARCGAYVLEEWIGAGAQGEVWLARDQRFSRQVALKLLRSGEHAVEERLRRFRREAEILSRWDHPSLCAVYDAGIEGGVPWYAMRLVSGPSLAEVLRRARAAEDGEPSASGPLARDASAIVACFEQLARAAHHAHEHGIVHRDLKPGNVVLPSSGAPVILDFGLAFDLRDGHLLTRTGDFLGTPAYMAPEQIEGRVSDIDARTDVWALGVALYETLTLRLPFEAATREALCREILLRDPAPLRRFRSDLPRDLEVVVRTALAKRPAHRYASAAALAEDLAAVSAGRTIRARPVGPLLRCARWARREPKLAALSVLAGALLALALVLVGFLVASRADAELGRQVQRASELERLLGQGFAEFGEGDATRAERSFESALVLEPSSSEAAAGLVFAALDRRDGARALQLLGTHAALLEPRSSARLLRARALELLGRGAEAEEERRALPALRDSVDAFLLGHFHLAAGHDQDGAAHRRALDAFTEAILRSRAPRALHHAARLHAAGHARDEAALTSSRETLQSHWPEAAQTPAAIGAALAHAGRSAEAVPWLREARRRDPRALSLGAHLALALARSGELDEAERVAAEICAAAEGAPHVHHARGEVRFAKGDYAGARADFEAELRARPSSLATRLELARALWLLGEQARAIEAIRAVLAVKPDHIVALANLATLLEQRGERAESEALRARLIAQRATANEPAAIGSIAVALASAGRAGEALALLDEWIAKAPSDAELHRRRAGLLADLERLDEAVDAARRARELAPWRAELGFELALLLRDAGWLDEAAARLDAHLRESAPRADLRALLALWQLDVGQREVGLANLRAALAAEELSRRGVVCCAEALYLAGEFDAALELLRERGDGSAELPWRERCEAAAEALPAARELRGGAPRTSDARELLWLAELACRCAWSAECTRWLAAALELDPEIDAEIEAELRFAFLARVLDGADAEGRALAARLATAGLEAGRRGAGGGAEELARARAAARRAVSVVELHAPAKMRASFSAAERATWDELAEGLRELAAPR